MNHLTLLAYGLILVFMTLIMTKRLSVLTALIMVPIIFALLAGFRSEIGPMMLDGIKAIAPTGVMLMFAILYFCLMIDAGLFDPVVRLVVRLVHGDPVRITVGTAVLGLVVSLDGDGSTTYLITTAAMLPIYRRLGMDRLILASIIMQAGGVMNLLPWGGPTARAAAALHVDTTVLFVPMIPAMGLGALGVVFVAWLLGRHERRRLGLVSLNPPVHATTGAGDAATDPAKKDVTRQHLRWFNLTLTMVLMACLVAGVLPLSILFMIATAIALVVNYPRLEDQKERIAANAATVFAMVSIVFAAGVFTGILSGTKMIDAMAQSIVHVIPPSCGPYLGVITAFLSLPFTFFISNDAFYYGVVPILSQAGANYGISAAEIGRAALVGQPVHLLSPLVPSTYLLVGLCGVELADHQKYTLKWSCLASFFLLLGALLTGAIPLAGH